MMGRPKISDDLVTQVRNLWAEDPEQSGLQVYNRYHRLPRSGRISKRKVQQIVAQEKRKSAGRNFPLVEWRPWTSDAEGPEDTAHLLQLDAVCLAAYGRHIYRHEANWAQRLRAALWELSPFHQLWIALMYSGREFVAFWLKDSPYTADLDGLIAYRPWLSGNERAYDCAIYSGATPLPLPALGMAILPGLPQQIRDQLLQFVERERALINEVFTRLDELIVETYDQTAEHPVQKEAYLERHMNLARFWDVIGQMWLPIPPLAHHIDREQQSIRARALDETLVFWARGRSEQPRINSNARE